MGGAYCAALGLRAVYGGWDRRVLLSYPWSGTQTGWLAYPRLQCDNGAAYFRAVAALHGQFFGVIASFLRQEDAPANIPGLARPGFWRRWLPRKLTYEGLVFEQDVREGRFQRILAIVTLFSAFFSGVEALYSHYKNNFSYRIQWSPVLIAPLLMLSSLGAIWSRTIARTLLPITSLLALINGVIGFFYHVRGVVRRPGGLHKPVYNVLYGPPILAPLLFSAAGFTGLLASLLRRARK